MTSPYLYGKWAEKADPKCRICHGTGAAFFAETPPLASVKLAPGVPPIGAARVATYESRCLCAAAPKED